jgi:hypothetical protein
MDGLDVSEQPFIADGPGRPATRLAPVVRGRRNARDPADRLDAKAAAMLVDECGHLELLDRGARLVFAAGTCVDETSRIPDFLQDRSSRLRGLRQTQPGSHIRSAASGTTKQGIDIERRFE